MYGEEPENIYYYLTVYNEPVTQPAEPEGVDVEGIVRGMYLVHEAPSDAEGPRAQLLASGVAVPWALRAAEMLAADFGVQADVWSVTSWNELRRDGLATDDWNFGHLGEEPREAYVAQRLRGRPGPVVATSDWMKAVADQIRPWVPSDFAVLGTDGFGHSDTRGALRRYFKVDAESLVVRTLAELARRGEVDGNVAREAYDRFQIDDPAAADPGSGLGES